MKENISVSLPPPPFTHHPHHDVREAGDPQGGACEGQHEPVVPARCGAVRDGEVQQQTQGPGQQPLQLVTHTGCKHTHEETVSRLRRTVWREGGWREGG